MLDLELPSPEPPANPWSYRAQGLSVRDVLRSLTNTKQTNNGYTALERWTFCELVDFRLFICLLRSRLFSLFGVSRWGHLLLN